MSESEPFPTRAAKRLKTEMSSPSNQLESTWDANPDISIGDASENPVALESSLDSGTPQQSSTSDGMSNYPVEMDISDEVATQVIGNTQPDTGSIGAEPKRGPDTPGWPAQQIPVEIYDMIAKNLPREDVQNLRLVNREFDAKLAGSYFKVVVVPFRPEFEALYGSLSINPGHESYENRLSLVLKGQSAEGKATDNEGQQNIVKDRKSDTSLLSDGYRVFEQFGASCMRKFALALELNEKDLAFPPLKVNQEIVSAPWGLYRWPIMRYQRYHQLEDLEQMADETGYMKKAFAFLTQVTDIGISCDAGLGWLQGPDINPFCANAKPAVFRPVTYGTATDLDDASTEQEDNASLSLTILKQMALNAGYNSNEWPRVILRLLEDEGRAVQWREHVLSNGTIAHERVPTLQVNENTRREDIIQHIEELINGEGDDVHISNDRGLGLVPNNLTPAQAEMLLELEWAHRALMQSYRTAVVDNRLSLKNLTQLTIARCPSCHVGIWCDRSFWASMTSIKTFHLGVIPDWRQVSKDSSGSVTQRRVPPINAAAEVFKLLQGYVGLAENIDHVSFEWVNGGEFAMGKSHRDRYILPAPVLVDPNMMVDMQPLTHQNVLSLPHVSKLSLKNCWVSPHIFLNLAKSLFRDNLSELILESVSLTGPPCQSPASPIDSNAPKPMYWPWPLCVGAEPGKWFMLHQPVAANNPLQMPPWLAMAPANVQMNFGNAMQQLAPQVPHAVNHWTAAEHGVAVAQQDRGWRAWSWPYVLAKLGVLPEYFDDTEPSDCDDKKQYDLAKKSYEPFSPAFKEVLENRDMKNLPRAIKLKSCGYALIDATHIDNWEIIPNHPIRVDHRMDLIVRLRELDAQMLFSAHGLFGKVLHYMPDHEVDVLRNTFDVHFGWNGIYDPTVITATLSDGVPEPGRARFSGNLSTHPRRMDISAKSKGKLIARS